MIPDHVIDHLKLREGVREDVYEDSLGKLTVGVGHLMSADEAAQWPLGATVTNEQVEAWLEEDAQTAWKAACDQSEWLKVDLKDALCYVNFQLGTHWYMQHKKTWAYLEAGEWENAAIEAADSRWFVQTPVRVQDFQEALRAL